MSETTDLPAPLLAWHRVVEAGDPSGLEALLADDCVFRSPAVHTAQQGKALTTAYLSAALVVLGPTLRYQHEWHEETDEGGSAVLEFTAERLRGLSVHGIEHDALGSGGPAHGVHGDGAAVQGADHPDGADGGRGFTAG